MLALIQRMTIYGALHPVEVHEKETPAGDCKTVAALPSGFRVDYLKSLDRLSSTPSSRL
jgi:hypothetical protein